MQALLAKLIDSLIRWVVVPLFSRIIMEIVAYFQAKKEESERNAKIDKAIDDFKNAKNSKEKEDAFRNLVRTR